MHKIKNIKISDAWHKIQIITINYQVFNDFLDKTLQGKYLSNRMIQCNILIIYKIERNILLYLWYPQFRTTVKSYHIARTNPITNMVLRIFMSQKVLQNTHKKTIHHHFIGWFKHQTLVLGTLYIPSYNIHGCLMWCLGVGCKTCAMMNSKVNLFYCILCQIQYHPYNRIIWFDPKYLILWTIIICPRRCINLVRCW